MQRSSSKHGKPYRKRNTLTINFFEPGDVPQPPDKVKIDHLEATIYPERWRIKVNIHVTPFKVRPSLAIALVTTLDDAASEAGEKVDIVSYMDVIETMHRKMEFTMHLSGVDDPHGDYVLKCRLYYDRNIHQPHDEKQIELAIPEHDLED